MFCGKAPVTAEHIFKRSFRKRLNLPEGSRQLARQDGLDQPMTTRPDRLFELKVRHVCAKCNNGWMNRLDLAVEPWVLEPGSHACDPKDLRRWAIKLAILISLTAQDSTVVPRSDYERLLAGEDLHEWHVMVGLSGLREWRHAHVGNGVRSETTGQMLSGVTHASWVVGASVATVLRPAGDPESRQLNALREYNLHVGEPFVEIPFTARTFPNLSLHRELLIGEAESFFWFFAAHPASPIYPIIKEGSTRRRDAIAARRKELGLSETPNAPRQHE